MKRRTFGSSSSEDDGGEVGALRMVVEQSETKVPVKKHKINPMEDGDLDEDDHLPPLRMSKSSSGGSSGESKKKSSTPPKPSVVQGKLDDDLKSSYHNICSLLDKPSLSEAEQQQLVSEIRKFTNILTYQQIQDKPHDRKLLIDLSKKIDKKLIGTIHKMIVLNDKFKQTNFVIFESYINQMTQHHNSIQYLSQQINLNFNKHKPKPQQTIFHKLKNLMIAATKYLITVHLVINIYSP